ncbi:MAG: hypothetical protein CME62_06025 [Halobacteriovoraceae bacterium]|nr:hypothetical protein [Halobacteriovoraceae bacterium]|tara:strand:- start:13581 stop:13928 length:348 start_codon:yes stop_codon:yes gene_type:complete
MAAPTKTKKDNFHYLSLYNLLESWVNSSPDEVQLDGSKAKTSNPKGWIYFISGPKFYKINGDTTKDAVETFLSLHKEHDGEFEDIFEVAQTDSGKECLRLRDNSDKAHGWYCYLA